MTGMTASVAIVLMPWRATSINPGAVEGLAKASRTGSVHLRTGMGLALLSSLRSALSSKARAASASVARDWPWTDAATPSHAATNAQTRWPILVLKVTLAPNVAPRILQRRTARVA